MYDTEIKVTYCVPATGKESSYWLASVIENGEQVWPDAVAMSYVSPHKAYLKLIDILDGKVAI